MEQARKSHARSTSVLSLILAAVTALFLFAGPAYGDSCTATFTGDLMKSEPRGETIEHFFKLVVRASVDCATVAYELEIHQTTGTSEEEVKKYRNVITVRTGSDRARLVSHRTAKGTEVTDWEFSITACNVCGT